MWPLMTEWWTCQTLLLPYTVCMSPPSASCRPFWDVLAYPRQFTGHFNIIHICWVKSNSQPFPMQRSYDVMTHSQGSAYIKHAWAAKQCRNAKQQGTALPTLHLEGQIPSGQTSPDCYLSIPPQQHLWFFFYSKTWGGKKGSLLSWLAVAV